MASKLAIKAQIFTDEKFSKFARSYLPVMNGLVAKNCEISGPQICNMSRLSSRLPSRGANRSSCLLVLSHGSAIQEEDLPEKIRRILPNASSFSVDLPDEGISLEAALRKLIVRALDRFKGNQTHAAKYLDISRRTLIYRIEKYGLT